MEDIITYIIVFGLLIGGVALWQFKQSKTRPYILSHQIFPELDLWLIIEKSEGKTKDFIIKLNPKKEVKTKIPVVELLNSKREVHIVDLYEFTKNKGEILRSEDSKIIYKYSFDEFSSLLNDGDFKFKTFRVSIENQSGSKFKSHELAFNKRWTIYRPDSGKYN